MRYIFLAVLAASIAAPGVAQTAPNIPSALNDKRPVVASKNYRTYTVYRVKGEGRYVVQSLSYPYTADGIFKSYATVDCKTGWVRTELKDHEKWLTPVVRFLPRDASARVVANFRGYCSALGIKPSF